MLVLCRREQEAIRVSDDITIRILAIQGRRVRIGIDAPPQTKIVRSELTDAKSIFKPPVTAGSHVSSGGVSPDHHPSGELS